MRRVTPVVFLGGLVLSYLAGYATSPVSSAAAQQSRGREPRYGVLAPDQGGPVHWSIDDMRKIHEQAIAGQRPNAFELLNLPNKRTHMFGFRTRPVEDHPPEAEQHEGVAELHVYVAGSGTVTVGGDIENRTTSQRSPGEHRGGPIRGGENFRVKAGDVLNIPVNAPHASVADPGGLSYLIVKVIAGLYPWSLVAPYF